MTANPVLDRIAGLPCWSGPVEIEPLAGGITNRNFLVTDRAKGRFVARLGDDIPVHGVMRFNERAAAQAAYEAGLSPEVVHAAEGILVSRFVEGRTLDPEAVRAPGMLGRIVPLLQRLHREVAPRLRGPVLVFWPFQVNRSYLGTLADEGGRLAAALPRLAGINAALERATGPVEMVFAHNDLLAGNLLDDGERLWLIDWDYAGFDSPLFDLANLSSNNGLSADEDAWLLTAYFGGPPQPRITRGFAAMKCASLLRETLWSAVSETRSTIAFDYVAYTEDYMRRFEAAYTTFASSEVS